MVKKLSTSIRYVIPAVLVLQVLFLIIMMFLSGNTMIDGDSARLYLHMEAIWNAKTLFVPDWIYPTTVELDCALLFALPFYGLFRDPVIAFCCANVVIILLWIMLIYALCKRINAVSSLRINPFLACLLVLTPYSTAFLYYWNMMFLNGSQYAFKVMLPLLLMYLLLAPKEKSPTKSDWICTVIYLASLFITALSSGIYVAAMGIAPLLLTFAVLWMYEKVPLSIHRLVCILGSIAATLAGLFYARWLGLDFSGGQMNLCSLYTLADNVSGCIVGFFRIFGAVTSGSTSVTRLAGMAQLLCWCLASVMLVRAGIVLFRAVRGKVSNTEYPALYLIAPAIWNFALLMILDTRYGDPYFEVRYHLMGGVPLFILACAHFTERKKEHPPRVRFVLPVLGTAFACALVLLCDRRAYSILRNPNGTLGINTDEHVLCDAIDQLDVSDVFIVQSNSAVEICSVLDPSRHYKLLWSQEDRCYLNTFDGPMSDTDADPSIGSAALVLPLDTDLSDLPSYLQNAVYKSETNTHKIYLLPNGSLPDGAVGLPYAGETGLDYANSDGYEYQGIMDENRCLSTAGYTGTVLHSPDLSLAQTTDITLTWGEESLADGTVSILQGDRVIAQKKISSGAQTTLLTDIPAGEGYALTVETASDAGLVLQSILFTAN